MFTLTIFVVYLSFSGTKITKEGDVFTVFIDIFVFPFPLITGNQDVQLGVFKIVDLEQSLVAGNAMTMSMIKGTTVQAISTAVLS